MLLNSLFDDHSGGPLRFEVLTRQKDHPNPQLIGSTDMGPQFLELFSKEPPRDLGEHPCPIAGFCIRIHCAPMGQIDNRAQGLFEYFVASVPGNVGNKANPAGIVLKCRAIKTVFKI